MRETLEASRGAAGTGSVSRTTCCVVGGGPGGAVAALLLARAGVDVMLLEAHPDFDREFRSDTIHPSTMEVMDALGLAERLLGRRHSKIRRMSLQTEEGAFTVADLSRLKTKFPYITMMPQTSFLEFVVGEARRYPNFRLLMNARVRELVEEGGVVRGVRYESQDGEKHEVRAALTLGADGRGSRVRRLAGFEPERTSPPMDVLWFGLPRKEDDPKDAVFRVGRGRVAILLERPDHWQVGYVIPKGTFPGLRRAGVESFGQDFAAVVPEMADRVSCLEDWRQISLLSVESGRCKEWYKPGLLLIRDAAHTMSPVGGVGINYATQDAVAAANALSGPLLLEGRGRTTGLDVRHLAAVQRRRELPTRLGQAFQALIQRRFLASALRPDAPSAPPAFMRLLPHVPLLRDLPARFFAFGVWPVRPEATRP